VFSGIVSAASFAGAVSGTTGNFSSQVSGVGSTWSGPVSGTSGVFSGTVSAAKFSGAIDATIVSAASAVFTGIVSGTSAVFNAVVSVSGFSAVFAVSPWISLTDAVSVAVNFKTGQNFVVQLGGNRTLENGTNLSLGQSGSIFIVQDGTGSRTLSYGASWKFPGGTAPTLTTTSAAIDRLDYVIYGVSAIQAVLTKDNK
jgi:hypothetical protein